MRSIHQDFFVESLKQLEEAEIGDAFTQPLREAVGDWCRCARAFDEGIDDVDFLRLGVERCLRGSESGRDFFQFARDLRELRIKRSAFFDLFHSKRRLGVLEDVAAGLFRDACRRLEVDLLAEFPELRDTDVFAGDGHLIEAACHAGRDEKGRKVAPKTFFILNVRNGLMLPLTAVQGDGRHAHELPPMRRHLPSFLQNNAEGRRALRRTILLVDMAMTDAAFWSRMKVAKKGGAMVIMPPRSDVKTIVMEGTYGVSPYCLLLT